MIRSGAQMKAPSSTLASTSDLVSTFSRFQMPRRVCISLWQGTEKSGPCSPEGCASHAEASHIVSAMSREAIYSQALIPKAGLALVEEVAGRLALIRVHRLVAVVAPAVALTRV